MLATARDGRRRAPRRHLLGPVDPRRRRGAPRRLAPGQQGVLAERRARRWSRPTRSRRSLGRRARVLLADRPARRFRLADPGRVPEAVHARVEGSIRSRHHRDLPGGGAWFVQRKVAGPRRHGAAGAPGPGHGPGGGGGSSPRTSHDHCGSRDGGPRGTGAVDEHHAGTRRPTSPSTTTAPARSTTCSPGSAPRPAPRRRPRAAARGTSPRCSPPAGPAPPSRRSTARRRWSRPPASGGSTPRRADVVDWTPAPDTDVVITNAVLQWVPQHRELLPRWVAALPAGRRARDAGAGQLRRAVARPGPRARGASGAWRCAVTSAVAEPAEYAALLAATGAEVDVWETTYLHRLTGPDPVLEWISSHGPAPGARRAGRRRPTRRSAPSWPRGCARPTRRSPDGTTWFPFRRIFAVARVPR